MRNRVPTSLARIASLRGRYTFWDCTKSYSDQPARGISISNLPPRLKTICREIVASARGLELQSFWSSCNANPQPSWMPAWLQQRPPVLDVCTSKRNLDRKLGSIRMRCTNTRTKSGRPPFWVSPRAINHGAVVWVNAREKQSIETVCFILTST